MDTLIIYTKEQHKRMSTNRVSSSLTNDGNRVLTDLIVGKLPTDVLVPGIVDATTVVATDVVAGDVEAGTHTSRFALYVKDHLNPAEPQYGTIMAGQGDPNTKVTAYVGSLYMNLSGNATTALWVKTSGTNTNTGWTAFVSA